MRWHRTIARDFAATHEPPLSREDADQRAFLLKSILLGYNHSRRLLDDEHARTMSRAAFERLLT